MKGCKVPLWLPIKSRFGGNVESKKMQKTILKKNFENFFVSNTEGLDKAYDRFQKLISLLEVHGVTVPNEDCSSGSSSNSQNVAFLSAEDTNSSNEVNTANNDEDLEQIDHDNLEEMDLKWKAAMLSMRVKRFYEKTRRKLIFNGKEPIANKNGDAGYRSRDNTRRTVPVKTSDALVVQDNALIVQDGLGYDWSYIAQDEPTEFALMAYTSNSSGSDTEISLSDGDDNQTNDKFKKDNGYHVVPPPLIGNYIPPLADLSFARLDDPVYRPTTNKTSASVSQVEKSTSQTRNTNVEMPKVESVRPSGVIIEDWTILYGKSYKKEMVLFGGNDESKKMQKYILKQQFEGFSVSNSEGLHKGYDRFQSLLSQLEIHGAGVSTEDANQKFLRSLPSSWSQYYITNDVENLLLIGVFTSSGYNSQRENSSSYTDELMYSFFANQSSGPHLDHEDLEQLDEFDLEEMDLKWQVAMISMRLKKEGVDWTDHAEDEQENFALMAYKNLGSDTEVTSCSKECVESYAKHKKLYDEQREQLDDASIEIQAYTQALKKVEAQFVTHQKNQLWSSDVEDSHVHDRFANVEGMHAVPPLMTGNYMPLGPDREVDDSMFTYGPKQSKISESDTQTSNYDSCESNSSTETLESVPEPVVVKPNVVSQPKVCLDAPIIGEYESDSDDEYVIQPSKEQKRPSFAFIDIVKHVKTPKETIKEHNTYSPSPKSNKRDCNGLMSKRLGLGYGFTKKACFVCGSFSHLIKDCDFHEKRMAKQVELNKKKGKGTGQGENRPV
ncbi:hypothetical protein Tco_1144030 [Tanacetum coccineum]